MQRVLLISAIFPPQMGGTSEKMAKRAKYFSRFGWQTVVLAPAIPPNTELDEGLLDELADTEIHRTTYLFQSIWPSLRHDKNRSMDVNESTAPGLFDLLFVPKGYLRWMPSALREGVRLAHSVDVLLTMNNPVTLHLTGLVLHKLTGKPWVAEIRDPIVSYAYGRRGPERLNRLLEKTIVRQADAIVQRGDGTPEDISLRFPHAQSKFTTIPYAGFESDDFADTPDISEAVQPDAQVVISYTGSFYGDTISPVPFLKGLDQLISQKALTPVSLRVYFAGDWDSQFDLTVDELGLRDHVKYLGRLSRRECIELWGRSHVLLLILGDEPDNLMRIPSKFWDYVGARRPILALVASQGRLATLIRQQGLGVVADPEDVAAISFALRELVEAHQRGELKTRPSPEFLSQAKRADSEKTMARVLKKVTKQGAQE